MNIAEHIARHLRDVYAGQNWTEVNLQTTLEDVSYEEASEVTPASVNTIAGLVHHLTFWNRVMAQRIAGMKVAACNACEKCNDLIPIFSSGLVGYKF